MYQTSTRRPVLSAALAATLLLVAVLATGSAAHGATLVIDGATVHPVSSPPAVGRIVITDGRITAVGPDAAVPAGADRLDAAGLHVYPGMFDAMSQLGLTEIGAVEATNDDAEMGRFTPHLRAATAVHPASELIPVARATGVTHALVAPGADRAGGIGGQAALLDLAGWTVEEMAHDPAIAMVVRWPAIQTRSFDFATFTVRETPFGEAKEAAEEAADELRDWFDAARHYAQAMAAGSTRLEPDLRLAALAEVVAGRQKVIVLADAKHDIEAAVAFAREQDIAIILAGGRDAHQVAELLAEADIPVILGFPNSLPNQDDDPYDLPFAQAGKLVAAGVDIAFGSSAVAGRGPGGPHAARTLPFEAAVAVAAGLPADVALRALTLAPAEIFGVAADLGSIEPGKVANLVVTDGDPLALTSQVVHLLIGGELIDLANKHEDLYRRYRGRPAATRP